jgi:hypothetical protein
LRHREVDAAGVVVSCVAYDQIRRQEMSEDDLDAIRVGIGIHSLNGRGIERQLNIGAVESRDIAHED